jgi:predicted RNA-binding Zn ribbon-like protein
VPGLLRDVGERSHRGFERVQTVDDLARWYSEAAVVNSPVPVTDADLDIARTVRKAVYRSVRALIDGQSLPPDDGEIINSAAAAPPPVPRMRAATSTGLDVTVLLSESARSAVPENAWLSAGAWRDATTADKASRRSLPEA